MKQPTPIKNIVPKLPKLTKEQKVISKALTVIGESMLASSKKTSEGLLNYAMGLLEALTITDDAKEENEDIKANL